MKSSISDNVARAGNGNIVAHQSSMPHKAISRAKVKETKIMKPGMYARGRAACRMAKIIYEIIDEK